MILICRFCKKTVPNPKWRNQVYCNKNCSYAALLKNNREKRRIEDGTSADWNKERTCPLCEKLFVPKTGSQKYCTKACGLRLHDFRYVHENLASLEKNKILSSSKASVWLKIRVFVFDRDKFRCQYCGRSPMKNKDVVLHADHKIPKKLGGSDDLENIITSCQECNLGKGDLLLTYWKIKK